MKNIFKKNQIIITALAIMIAIAGYLSFTNNDKPEDTLQTANPDQEDYDVFSEVDGMDVATDTTGGTDATDDLTGDTDATTQDDTTDGTLDATDVETTADDENDETVPVDTEDDTDELGDISDDDILTSAQDVTDTGELETEDDTVPGEAVLVSATVDPGYFSTAKFRREQQRSISRENLLLLIESPDLSEDQKKDAVEEYLELNNIADTENSIEILLEAKGFDGVVVSINNDDVEVIVNAPNITEQQVAIIEEEVKRKANVTAEQITITPTVVDE